MQCALTFIYTNGYHLSKSRREFDAMTDLIELAQRVFMIKKAANLSAYMYQNFYLSEWFDE